MATKSAHEPHGNEGARRYKVPFLWRCSALETIVGPPPIKSLRRRLKLWLYQPTITPMMRCLCELRCRREHRPGWGK